MPFTHFVVLRRGHSIQNTIFVSMQKLYVKQLSKGTAEGMMNGKIDWLWEDCFEYNVPEHWAHGIQICIHYHCRHRRQNDHDVFSPLFIHHGWTFFLFLSNKCSVVWFFFHFISSFSFQWYSIFTARTEYRSVYLMQYFVNRTYIDRDIEFTNGKWPAHAFILFTKSPTMFHYNSTWKGYSAVSWFSIAFNAGIWSLMQLHGKSWNTKHCSYSFYYIDDNTMRNHCHQFDGS